MPYIEKRLRHPDHVATSSGELNFKLTSACLDYLDVMGTSYSTFNDILGALEGCKLELYRRQIASYEDQKIISNGDVFPQTVTT